MSEGASFFNINFLFKTFSQVIYKYQSLSTLVHCPFQGTDLHNEGKRLSYHALPVEPFPVYALCTK